MTQKIALQGEELEPRAREVLREVVAQYVETGEPVSSRSLAKCGRFALSPATLRNVMADLEDLGFVFQPHTSAGRVPTDRGYRFINHLMRSRRLSAQEQQVIDDGFEQVSDLDEVMQVASKNLSRLSNQVGLVFLPKLHQLVMRSIDFIQVSETKLLCVVVGTNGVVVNKVIETTQTLTREQLQKSSRYLSLEFSGQTLENVRAQLMNLVQQERSGEGDLRESITLGIEAVEDVLPAEHDLYVEGAASILTKPDFTDEQMRKTFLAFDDKEDLVAILTHCLSEDGIQILIGSESRFTRSYNLSLVATRYGAGPQPLGLVAVIGPRRMEYARMAPLVDYLGRALSRKIEESKQEQTS